MCNTKERISAMLRMLMQDRPLEKITVQDLMDGVQMKRQSFYYHFQDIYDVLDWEIDRCLFSKLGSVPGQGLEDWLERFLSLVDEDRNFHRKTLIAVGRRSAVERISPVVHAQAERALLGDLRYAPSPSEEERFAVEFVTYALVNYLIDTILSREPLNSERNRRRLQAVCAAAAGFRPQTRAAIPRERPCTLPA